MALPKKAYLSCFVPRKQIRGDLKAHLAIEMSLNNIHKHKANCRGVKI